MGKGFFKLPHFLKKLLSHPSSYFVPVFSPPPKYAADQTRPQVFNPGGGTHRNPQSSIPPRHSPKPRYVEVNQSPYSTSTCPRQSRPFKFEFFSKSKSKSKSSIKIENESKIEIDIEPKSKSKSKPKSKLKRNRNRNRNRNRSKSKWKSIVF